jgi:phosphatidylinositol glycan class W
MPDGRPGYVAIHLLGMSAGTLVLPSSPSYFPRALKGKNTPPAPRDDGRAAVELAAWATVWWAALGACLFLGVGGAVSRRLVRLPVLSPASADVGAGR